MSNFHQSVLSGYTVINGCFVAIFVLTSVNAIVVRLWLQLLVGRIMLWCKLLSHERDNQQNISGAVDGSHFVHKASFDLNWVTVVDLYREVGKSEEHDPADCEDDTDDQGYGVLWAERMALVVKHSHLLLRLLFVHKKHCQAQDER